MWSKQYNVGYGYNLSIFRRTEENHAKPWSSCPVAGPCGCKLTSRQQSAIKYANPNVGPYLRYFLIWKKKKFTCLFLQTFRVRTLDEHQTVVLTYAKRLHVYTHIHTYIYICVIIWVFVNWNICCGEGNLQPDVHLHNIFKLCSYLSENTLLSITNSA
jgi:hypothetical protein